MFNTLWTKATSTFRGLPRPYADVPSALRLSIKAKGLKIAKKVPIPWQSFSKLHEGKALGVIKEHEEEVLSSGTCAYCGLSFDDNDLATIWTTYPDEKMFENGSRVFSDHLPFHINCMKEARLFCPHLMLTKDDEYQIGLYKNLLKDSRDYIINNFNLEE